MRGKSASRCVEKSPFGVELILAIWLALGSRSANLELMGLGAGGPSASPGSLSPSSLCPSFFLLRTLTTTTAVGASTSAKLQPACAARKRSAALSNRWPELSWTANVLQPIPQTQDAGRDKQQLDAQGAFVESFAQLFAHSIRTPVLRTPKEYGLEYEDVWFPSLDGVVLEGWFIPCKGSKKLIIANHPLPCNRYGFPGHLEQYNQFGGFEGESPCSTDNTGH